MGMKNPIPAKQKICTIQSTSNFCGCPEIMVTNVQKL